MCIVALQYVHTYNTRSTLPYYFITVTYALIVINVDEHTRHYGKVLGVSLRNFLLLNFCMPESIVSTYQFVNGESVNDLFF